MGSWWRSEEMVYVSLIMSEQAAPAVVRELGNIGCMQIIDLNPELTPFQRRYVSYIKRCDEIERKIRYLNGEIKSLDIPIKPAGEVSDFIDNPTDSDALSHGAYLLETLESKLDMHEQQLLELNKYSVKLTEEYNSKVEYHHVLQKARTIFGKEMGNIENAELKPISGGGRGGVDTGISLSPLISAASAERGGVNENQDLIFSNVAGVLPLVDKVRFERMLFRATRGNCYVRFSDITITPGKKDEEDRQVITKGPPVDKTVFIIFYKSQAIEGKIKRICDAFSARRFDLADLDRPLQLATKQEANLKELTEAKQILDKNIDTRYTICDEIALQIESWLWTVRREKAIYHTLNSFKSDISNVLRCRAWILKNKIG